MEGKVLQRITLSPRDNDVERLISGLPFDYEGDRNKLRQWVAALKSSASRWQITKAQANALQRAGQGVRRG